jgi:adenylate cyclase
MEFKRINIRILLIILTLFFIIAFSFGVVFVEKKSDNILFLCVLSFLVISTLCAYSYRYLILDSSKAKIQRVMSKYLSYDVMQNVVKNIDNISLGGKKADVTILFADIRNFTSISESMDAQSTTEILNEYFSALVPIIEEYNGVLNKFMGDAILAIFGEPKKTDNHALDAVQCANRMLKKVKALQEKWLEEGKPKIEIGIGISTGEAFIGNIGSQDRLEYTVIGDTVNTANRIEGYNKVYKTNFLISETTYKRVRSKVDAIKINNVIIRGKSNKINLYEVVKLVD